MNAKKAKALRREVYGEGSKRGRVEYGPDGRALGKRGEYRQLKKNDKVRV
jgi:hypothetical protein